MNNSKLLNVLQSFSDKELKQLRKWILQTSDKKDAVTLFLHIYKMLPKIKEGKVSKENLHTLLYGKKKYNDSRMRYLLFELFSLCEEFIAWQSLEKNQITKQLALLQFYNERKSEKLFEETEHGLREQLNALDLRNQDYFFAGMKLHSERNRFLKQKQQRNIEPNIQNFSDHLDLFYLTSKLRVYSEALNYENLLKVNYNIRFIDKLSNELTKEDLENYPAVRIQKLAINTLLDPQNELYLFRLKEELERNRNLFSKEERNDLFTLARNYCIRRINKGEKKFIRTLFELYRAELDGLKDEINPELSPVVFKNVITLALQLKEINWVSKFISTYSAYLPAAQRDSLVNYNNARLHFINRHYEKAIRLLMRVKYPDFFLQLGAKALLLQNYFESGEELAFDSLVHSFKELLHSKKQLSYHKNNYMNFIRITDKLFRSDWKTESDRRKLLREIKQSPELVEREWLLNKMEMINLTSKRRHYETP